LGVVVCVAVAIATVSEGFEYFFGYWRATGIAGMSMGGLAYLNWLLMSLLAMFRAHRAMPGARHSIKP
jgi:hypothetical protein